MPGEGSRSLDGAFAGLLAAGSTTGVVAFSGGAPPPAVARIFEAELLFDVAEGHLELPSLGVNREDLLRREGGVGADVGAAWVLSLGIAGQHDPDSATAKSLGQALGHVEHEILFLQARRSRRPFIVPAMTCVEDHSVEPIGFFSWLSLGLSLGLFL